MPVASPMRGPVPVASPVRGDVWSWGVKGSSAVQSDPSSDSESVRIKPK